MAQIAGVALGAIERPSFSVQPLDPEMHVKAIQQIAVSLRPEDLYECAAVSLKPAELPLLVASCSQRGEAFLISRRGVPVFMWGVFESDPGHYYLWGFGTKDTRHVITRLTRWGVRSWLPNFVKSKRPRRIEVRIPVSSAGSFRWLRSLGLKVETVLDAYSVHGEPFYQLAYTRPMFERDFQECAQSQVSIP